MGTNKIPTVARKAIEWLRKMNIEVKPVIGFDDMYIFKYNDVFMFIRTDTKPKELFLGAPVSLWVKLTLRIKQFLKLLKI